MMLLRLTIALVVLFTAWGWTADGFASPKSRPDFQRVKIGQRRWATAVSSSTSKETGQSSFSKGISSFMSTLTKGRNNSEAAAAASQWLELLANTTPAATGSGLFRSVMGLFGKGISAVSSSVANDGNPYGNGPAVYDVAKTEAFYRQRPWLVLARLMKIATLSLPFQAGLLMDWRSGNMKKNEAIRAQQALRILENLGPTFVKLGQSLSIRTDLIPEAYATALKKLQDSVPPFDNDLAKTIICQELNIQRLDEKFRTFSEKPLASASIGQVYRATLLDGREVAVKVQRPNILNEISLDLHLLRLVAPLQVLVTNLAMGEKTERRDTDLVYGMVDEWGRGLVGEVNYLQEAKNTRNFIQAMEKRGLHSVTSPRVIEGLSGARVLVTEWITGTRLDRDESADVPRLCGVALNAYLTMLLDTGVLHCDPHPGNLLRTPDGRLCILDWGMTLDLPKDLQYGLLEFIAHVNAEDFDELPEDFVKLGMTPPDRLEDVRRAGIAKGFAVIMRQLGKGGGPKHITDGLRKEFKERYGDLSDEELTKIAKGEMARHRDRLQPPSKTTGSVEDDVAAMVSTATEELDVSDMAGLLEMISKRNRDVFKLPSYMLYVFRAFSTLEGIGLSVNPDYSILNECYPYLAKRLLTDVHPRAQKALRQMMLPNGRLRLNKLLEFSQGFQQYTSAVTSLPPSDLVASNVTAATNANGTATASSAAAAPTGRSVGAKRPTSSASASVFRRRAPGAGRSAPHDITDLLFEPRANNMQDLVVETAATITDSLVRFSLHQLRTSLPGQLAQLAVRAPKTMIDIFVPPELRPFLLPFTLPATLPHDLTQAMLKLTAASEDDLSNIQSLRVLLKELEPGLKKRVRATIRDMMPLRPAGGDDDSSVVVPLTASDSSVVRRALGVTSSVPVFLRLTRKFGASILATAAQRMQQAASGTGPTALPGSGGDEAKALLEADDDVDYEIELLLTEQLGSLTSATAKTIARVIDTDSVTMKFDQTQRAAKKAPPSRRVSGGGGGGGVTPVKAP